jgi:hypothetical protein
MVRGMQQRTQNLQLTETDGETVGEVAGMEKRFGFLLTFNWRSGYL